MQNVNNPTFETVDYTVSVQKAIAFLKKTGPEGQLDIFHFARVISVLFDKKEDDVIQNLVDEVLTHGE